MNDHHPASSSYCNDVGLPLMSKSHLGKTRGVFWFYWTIIFNNYTFYISWGLLLNSIVASTPNARLLVSTTRLLISTTCLFISTARLFISTARLLISTTRLLVSTTRLTRPHRVDHPRLHGSQQRDVRNVSPGEGHEVFGSAVLEGHDGVGLQSERGCLQSKELVPVALL